MTANNINKKNSIRTALDFISSPAVAFYILPLLMLLLVVGTIAQTQMGLYDARQKYFSNFILWLGPIPLPGAYSLISIISIGVLIKFIFKSDWKLIKTGINLAHLGVIILLLGGLITALSSQEGYMVIAEGQKSATISDYHDRELVILRNEELIGTVPYETLVRQSTITSMLPFDINILETCRNCKIVSREDTLNKHDNTKLQGMAQFMALEKAPLEKEEETNLYGATFSIDNKIYIIFEGTPKPITIEHNENVFEIFYNKSQRFLPFSLRLQSFVKTVYPGTETAKSYHSDVIIEDGKASWPVRIEMNQPLRYKGYTFFQSSFAKSESKNITILTVVKNEGWLFPYIGTAIIAFGLLFHALVRMKKAASR